MKVYKTPYNIAEIATEANAVSDVITFLQNIEGIYIYHEEATWQEFVVNGITLTIPAGGYSSAIGGEVGATVTIPTGISCLVHRLGLTIPNLVNYIDASGAVYWRWDDSAPWVWFPYDYWRWA